MPRVHRLRKKKIVSIGPADVLYLALGHDFFSESRWPDPPDIGALADMRRAWGDPAVRRLVETKLVERQGRGHQRERAWAEEAFSK